jgi:hypothetical protein
LRLMCRCCWRVLRQPATLQRCDAPAAFEPLQGAPLACPLISCSQINPVDVTLLTVGSTPLSPA